MTVKEIIIEYLAANGYDGLAGDECGCTGDSLIACGEGFELCEPGHLARGALGWVVMSGRVSEEGEK